MVRMAPLGHDDTSEVISGKVLDDDDLRRVLAIPKLTTHTVTGLWIVPPDYICLLKSWSCHLFPQEFLEHTIGYWKIYNDDWLTKTPDHTDMDMIRGYGRCLRKELKHLANIALQCVAKRATDELLQRGLALDDTLGKQSAVDMKDVYSVLTNTNQRELFKKDHVAFFCHNYQVVRGIFNPDNCAWSFTAVFRYCSERNIDSSNIRNTGNRSIRKHGYQKHVLSIGDKLKADLARAEDRAVGCSFRQSKREEKNKEAMRFTYCDFLLKLDAENSVSGYLRIKKTKTDRVYADLRNKAKNLIHIARESDTEKDTFMTMMDNVWEGAVNVMYLDEENTFRISHVSFQFIFNIVRDTRRYRGKTRPGCNVQ